MDLNKKLAYYRKTSASKNQNQKTAPQASLPASVKALMEHFSGRLLPYPVPIVEITVTEQMASEELAFKLDRLTRKQFPEPIPLDQCLFFDLETTGLSGGAGTYAFLLGFGYYEGQQFKVVQYFLPDFGRDYYVFKELQPLLEKKSILISFNGKSYDLPLLKTRAILNRFELDVQKFQHLDLLHLARRVWKDSQESCDLFSIEKEQLGFTRTDDIPGYLIPTAYLRFIQSGVIHEMISTIKHNQLDILSLNKMLVKLSAINDHPELVDDPHALLRLARLAFEIDDFVYFLRIEKRLLELESQNVPSFHLIKSYFFKKQRQWAQACELWEALIPHRQYAFLALEELAKVHEHVFKDHSKAMNYVRRALEMYRQFEQLNPYWVKTEWKSAFLHRYQRLKSKLS